MSAPGYCYAIETDDAFKFGFSSEPWRRLAGINSTTPSPARMVGYVAASKIQEARLHELLRKFKIRGEWYRKCPITIAIARLFPVRSAARGPSGLKSPELNGPAAIEARSALEAAICDAANLSAVWDDIATKSGLSPRRVRGIWHGEARRIMPREIELIREAVALRRASRPLGQSSHQVTL